MSFGFAIVQHQLPSSRVSFKCVHMIIPPPSPPPPPHHLIQNSHYMSAWKDNKEEVRTFVHIYLFSWNFWILGAPCREGIDRLRSDKIGAFWWGPTCRRRIIAECVKILKMNLYPLSLCYGRTQHVHADYISNLVLSSFFHKQTNVAGCMLLLVVDCVGTYVWCGCNKKAKKSYCPNL